MKDVKWKGELSAKAYIDTLQKFSHLYGMGPLAYLRGEILILDGTTYVSRVLPDSGMQVEKAPHVTAPFFGYSYIAAWREVSLPDSVSTIPALESWIGQSVFCNGQPFMFRLKGVFREALIHIVNLPEGSAVRSPEDAHRGRVEYPLTQIPAEILGFYSTRHRGVFTHHDSYLHMHLITDDLKKMGHVDQLTFNPADVKLYLPR